MQFSKELRSKWKRLFIIQNEDNQCFCLRHIGHLTPMKKLFNRLIDLKIFASCKYKDIEFLVSKTVTKRLKQKIISVLMYLDMKKIKRIQLIYQKMNLKTACW